MNRLYYLFIPAFFLIVFAGVIYSSSALDLQRTRSGYTTVVELPEVSIEQVKNGYVAVNIRGYYYNNTIGMAGLPETMFRLAIGKQKIVPKIKVTELETETKVLLGKIHPMQQDFPLNIPLSERPFSFDLAYYRSVGKTEKLVSVSEPFVCHGVPGVEVTIRPVSYNPAMNVITIVKKFKFDITMPEGLSAIPAISSKASHAFVKNIFINYNVPLKRDGCQKNDAYLILCESGYENNDALDEFVTFRQQLYDVTKVQLSEAGSSAEQVQSYIRGLDPKPTYVIFVGNPSSMPHFTSGNPSYWQYSLKEDSDKYSDIFVGMFSVRDEEGLANIVRKTIYTEENINDYPQNVCLYSTYDGDGHIDRQVTYIKERYWDNGGWESDWQIADDNSSLSATQATTNTKSAINSNAAKYVCYQGHGGSSGFSPGIGMSDVSNMTNTVVYPFVLGFACSTGDWTRGECFGERWIVAEHGACMYTGASVSSASYQKIFNAGMACGAAVRDELTTIGQIFYFGKHFVFDTTISESGFNTNNKTGGSQMYNLFGDPALAAKPFETGISDVDKTTVLPLSFRFVTPNTISLNIPQSGKYTIAVYSADGRKIHTVAAKKYLGAGEHTIQWNGKALSSGVYFVHLNSNKKLLVDKCVILQ